MNPHPAIQTSTPGRSPASDDRIEFNSGGGWLIVFGLIFAFMGLLTGYRFVAAGLAAEPGAGSSPFAALAGGLLFFVGGLVIAFGRRAHVLDRRAGTVITRWAMFGFGTTRTRALAEFDRVHLEKRIVQSKNSSHEVFPVELRGSGAALALVQSRDYDEARRKAETVAKFLGLAVHDATTDAVSVRETDRLDEGLREQALRLGETAQWPELPEGSRIQYRTEGEEAVIDLPPSSLAALQRVIMVVIGLVFIDVVLFLFLPLLVPDVPRGMMIGGLVLWLAATVGVAGVLVKKRVREPSGRGERLVVSARELRFEHGASSSAPAWTLPANELEELVLEPPADHPAVACLGLTGGLVARSDRQTFRFASGLSLAECTWLRDVIRYIIIDVAADAPETA